jgi:hypothetical protein
MNDLPQTCESCGAPVGPDLLPLDTCWYWGQMKYKLEAEARDYADWKRQGYDPPCEGNHYTQWSQRRDLQLGLVVVCLLFGIPLLLLLVLSFS